MFKRVRLTSVLLLGSLLSACSQIPTDGSSPQIAPTQPRAPAVTAESIERSMKDIEFIPGGGAFQSLDVYLPAEGEGPFPTILAIHGGAFRARSKNLYAQIAPYLTTRGYAVVATNYRYSSKASYPAQVEDVFCSLAWIHSNADKYGFDPERVFAWGGSAGGYLTAMLGTVETPSRYLENCPHTLPDSDWLRGLIIFYGFYDFTNIDGYPAGEVAALQSYWGASYSELPAETLAEMSPMSWVDGTEPPMFITHGTADQQIPSWMSEDFAAALRDAGVDVELLLIDAGHAFEIKPLSGPEMTQALEAIEAFLGHNTE